jgi:NAD(P)-dependent dehydrogenase (short-subunit alcohol dehydrogenase family)
MRLQGKTALIAGGASGIEGQLMGIGGATARLFAREGAQVVIADIKDDVARKTVDEIAAEGGEASYVHLDVTNEQEWIAAVQATVNAFGKLGVLVDAAGTSFRHNVEETTVEVWDLEMAVHGRGAFLGTKHLIPEMRKIGGGSIVIVSSIYGIVGALTTSYPAAKGAMRNFTKAAAIQYASENIRVNSVHPGFVLSPLTEGFFSDPAIVNPRLERVPMGRLGTVEEIANGIQFLASDESSFVTGIELVIDGGFIAQ